MRPLGRPTRCAAVLAFAALLPSPARATPSPFGGTVQDYFLGQVMISRSRGSLNALPFVHFDLYIEQGIARATGEEA
jgi:hypothetical protein